MLKETYKEFIRETFMPYSSVSGVRVFGSYAKGVATSKSDIDIAYHGTLQQSDYAQIWTKLRYHAPFLMRCDIVAYDTAPRKLQEHIDRVGLEL